MPLSQEQRDFITVTCKLFSDDELLKLKKDKIKMIKFLRDHPDCPASPFDEIEAKKIIQKVIRARNFTKSRAR